MFVVDLYPNTSTIRQTGANGEYLVEKEMLVSLKLSNLTNENRIFYGVYPRIKFANNTTVLNNYFYLNGVTSIQNQNPDFFLTFNDADSYFEIAPSANFSVEGNVCVPADTVLQAIAIVKFNVILNLQSGQSPSAWYSENSLSGIDFYGTYSSTVTNKTPLGSHADTNNILQNILEALQGNSGTNQNVSSDSSTLKTQSDQVHQQEAAYYTANTQAIEATGLSNYQFSTSQSNGIGAVRNDFVAIWNAMDGWTSVYIFSLTLGLALTIIRHAPSAISRRRRRSKE